MSNPLVQSRALGDPLPCDYALRILECAYRRQSGRGRLHSLVSEVSGYRHHRRGDGVAIGSVTCEVPGDHLLWMWPTLHRHAGSKCDHVQPRRTDTGVRPVDEPCTLPVIRMLSVLMSMFSSVSPSSAPPTVSSTATNLSKLRRDHSSRQPSRDGRSSRSWRQPRIVVANSLPAVPTTAAALAMA